MDSVGDDSGMGQFATLDTFASNAQPRHGLISCRLARLLLRRRRDLARQCHARGHPRPTPATRLPPARDAQAAGGRNVLSCRTGARCQAAATTRFPAWVGSTLPSSLRMFTPQSVSGGRHRLDAPGPSQAAVDGLLCIPRRRHQSARRPPMSKRRRLSCSAGWRWKGTSSRPGLPSPRNILAGDRRRLSQPGDPDSAATTYGPRCWPLCSACAGRSPLAGWEMPAPRLAVGAGGE